MVKFTSVMSSYYYCLTSLITIVSSIPCSTHIEYNKVNILSIVDERWHRHNDVVHWLDHWRQKSYSLRLIPSYSIFFYVLIVQLNSYFHVNSKAYALLSAQHLQYHIFTLNFSRFLQPCDHTKLHISFNICDWLNIILKIDILCITRFVLTIS